MLFLYSLRLGRKRDWRRCNAYYFRFSSTYSSFWEIVVKHFILHTFPLLCIHISQASSFSVSICAVVVTPSWAAAAAFHKLFINSPFNRHSVALPLIRRFVFHIPMHPRLHLRLLLLLGSQYHIHFIDGSVYLHRRSGHINGQARNLSVTPHSVQLLSTGPAVSTPLTQFACSQPTRLTSSVGRRETSPPIFSGPGCLVAWSAGNVEVNFSNNCNSCSVIP